MATITKRETGWKAQVRRKGYSARTKTFTTKAQAEAWAREQEAQMDRGDLPRSDKALKLNDPSRSTGTLPDRGDAPEAKSCNRDPAPPQAATASYVSVSDHRPVARPYRPLPGRAA
jgi:hypothetical protein